MVKLEYEGEPKEGQKIKCKIFCECGKSATAHFIYGSKKATDLRRFCAHCKKMIPNIEKMYKLPRARLIYHKGSKYNV